MKIYVASALENLEQVKRLITYLESEGHKITYNWTAHGPVFKPEKTAKVNEQVMKETARMELVGVTHANLLIALLPGGRGTHAEIGCALGESVPVLIGSQTELYDTKRDKWPCAFHYHPGVAARIIEENETRLLLRLVDWAAAYTYGRSFDGQSFE